MVSHYYEVRIAVAVPCGTPEITPIRLDCLPPTATLYFLFLLMKIINP